MRASVSTARLAALLAGAAAGLLGVPAASAADSSAAAAVAGAPITSLPFYGTGDVTGAGTGGRGTAAANAAVAAACNGGAAISGPQWYALPAANLGRVAARADAPFYPRGVDQNPSGTAFVDVRSGRVLACGSTAVGVTAQRPVAVVAYYSAPVDTCTPDQWCAGGSLRLFVGAVPGKAPGNDDWQHAPTIKALPLTHPVDTSTADDDGPAVFDYEHLLRAGLHPRQPRPVWGRGTPPP